MDLRDVFSGGHMERPDHPDFWRLSEIILELKAAMAENDDDPVAQEKVWRGYYERIGDFQSILYHAVQAAIQTGGYEWGSQLRRAFADPKERAAFVRAVQTYLDGFVMGAEFVKRGGHQEEP